MTRLIAVVLGALFAALQGLSLWTLDSLADQINRHEIKIAHDQAIETMTTTKERLAALEWKVDRVLVLLEDDKR